MIRLSAVVPAFDAEPHLARVLAPLLEARRRGELEEVLVVDDGSSDGSADLGRRAGAVVLSSGGRLGPAACRNLGVAHVRSEAVLFVDADVVIHDSVPRKVRAAFESDPGCVAVFGSYDDRPAAAGPVSRYRNLLHHHVHQLGRTEASTFWAGCGAVRREAFLAAGGFDAQRYPHPSIEDIELGLRLRRQGGRIRLDKTLLGTHLKRWTLRSVLHTDIFRRALPWSRLILASGRAADDLNLSTPERLRALLALLLAGSLAASPWPPALWASPLLALTACAASSGFYRLTWRRGGPAGALTAFLLHQLYYLTSTGTYAWCRLEALLHRPRQRPARV